VRNAAREVATTATREIPKLKDSDLYGRKKISNSCNSWKSSYREERFIAKEMTKFLPSTSNKQIRDKRSETTYRNQLRELKTSLEHRKERT
jgi:hypothetical protein